MLKFSKHLIHTQTRFSTQLPFKILNACRQKDVAKAQFYFDQLGDNNTYDTYRVLIDAYCSIGEIAKAEQLFQTMLSKNITPNVLVYNSLITAHCARYNSYPVERLLQEMIDRNIEPNEFTLIKLITLYFRVMKPDVAEKIWNLAVSENVVNLPLCNLTLRGFCIAKKFDKVPQILKVMKQRDIKADEFTKNVLTKYKLLDKHKDLLL